MSVFVHMEQKNTELLLDAICQRLFLKQGQAQYSHTHAFMVSTNWT